MLVYLDNAATTPINKEVLEVMKMVLEEEFGNELGRLDKKTQSEIGLRLAELDKISPNHPKVKAFRLKYLQVMKK